MAHTLITLADLVKINDANLADLEISDLLDDAPLLAALAAGLASNGTSHKYTKESGAPVVGFRAPNTGRDHSASADTLVTIDLKILDASFHVDKAVADAYQRGGPAALVAREAKRHIKAAFALAEKQLIYGTGNDANGFVGLANAATLDGLADAMVHGAGGSGARTSVYLIRTNDDGTDCTVIAGDEGKLTMGETAVQMVDDGTGKLLPAYATPITGWLGLQIGSQYSVARIANVGTGATLTDAMIYKALEKFPASRQPNLIVMNRRSLAELRAARTATNATGAPAPRPTEVEGIPIVTTDALGITETAVA